jgi:hypothetical protein
MDLEQSALMTLAKVMQSNYSFHARSAGWLCVLTTSLSRLSDAMNYLTTSLSRLSSLKAIAAHGHPLDRFQPDLPVAPQVLRGIDIYIYIYI